MNLEELKHYLPKEKIVEIAEEAFRGFVSDIFSNETNIERLFNMFVEHKVGTIIDEDITEDVKKDISERVLESVKGLSTYDVFRQTERWDREERKGFKYLQKYTEEHKSVLSERVLEIMSKIDMSDLKVGVSDMVSEHVYNALFKEIK